MRFSSYLTHDHSALPDGDLHRYDEPLAIVEMICAANISGFTHKLGSDRGGPSQDAFNSMKDARPAARADGTLSR
jgi:hypothetical protein